MLKEKSLLWIFFLQTFEFLLFISKRFHEKKIANLIQRIVPVINNKSIFFNTTPPKSSHDKLRKIYEPKNMINCYK